MDTPVDLLRQALDDLHECRVQRDRARTQARDRLDRLDRIRERHTNDGYGACSWDGLNFPCPDGADATGRVDTTVQPGGD
jgi:hypothetical protein